MAAELASRPYCERWRNPQGKSLRKVHQEGKFSESGVVKTGNGSWAIGNFFFPITYYPLPITRP
jgi:hypothetical protein